MIGQLKTQRVGKCAKSLTISSDPGLSCINHALAAERHYQPRGRRPRGVDNAERGRPAMEDGASIQGLPMSSAKGRPSENQNQQKMEDKSAIGLLGPQGACAVALPNRLCTER